MGALVTKMTVRWHVDDLMISHASQCKILEFVRYIKDIYGEFPGQECRHDSRLPGNDLRL